MRHRGVARTLVDIPVPRSAADRVCSAAVFRNQIRRERTGKNSPAEVLVANGGSRQAITLPRPTSTPMEEQPCPSH